MSLHEHTTGYERVAGDFYVEPAWAVEALFAAERFVGSVFDPAAGVGTIVGASRERGFNTFGADLADRDAPEKFHIHVANFLEINQDFTATDNIISNPPYADAENFVRVALNVARHKVAFLLRLPFLESKRRADLFEETPLARVLVFANRVPIAPGHDLPYDWNQEGAKHAGSKTAYAWFVWDKDWMGPSQLRWLRKPEEA